MARIHRPPFEEGYRPYDFDPTTVRKWTVIKIDELQSNSSIFKWCEEHLIGEYSITPKGMAFEHDEDAFRYKIQFGGRT